MTPAPEYLQYRIDMFDRLKAEAEAALKGKNTVDWIQPNAKHAYAYD